MSPRHAGSSARRWSPVLVVAVAAAAAAGCSSPSPSAHGHTSTTTSTTPTASSTAPTTATTVATVPGCSGSNYAVSLLGSQGAAGTFELTLGLRNTADATCPIGGYPGVELLGAGGTPLTTNAVRGDGESFTDFAPTTVSVPPSGTAYFNLGYSDVPTGTESSCPTATGLQIIPPNTTTTLRVSGSFQVCNGGTVDVSPLFGKGSPETETTAPSS